MALWLKVIEQLLFQQSIDSCWVELFDLEEVAELGRLVLVMVVVAEEQFQLMEESQSFIVQLNQLKYGHYPY